MIRVRKGFTPPPLKEGSELRKPFSKGHRLRLRKSRLYKKRMLEKAKYSKGFRGLFLDDGRVKVVERGNYSKFLRRLGNKRVRANGELLRYGQYRKVFDYWWELD